MGLEEKLPSGVLLTSVEKVAGWAVHAAGIARLQHRSMCSGHAINGGHDDVS